MLQTVWAILILALPTQPNAVRLRVWRILKSLGCAALRDGAYLLPMEHASLLEEVAREVRDHGGTASVMELSPRDASQREEVLAQFDRTDAYAQWREVLTGLILELDGLGETEARRRLRGSAEALQALRRIDYYPQQSTTEQAEAELLSLRQTLDARFSRGEPQPRVDAAIKRVDARKFQGKRWGTRARPWVDRLACAWLIRRFVDPQARFVWLPDPAKAPRGVIGFDFDGAQFTHVGTNVTFEVILSSFGLSGDLKLQRIARAVHYLDVGGIPVPEAAGLEGVLGGLRELHPEDDRLVRSAALVFDALYASPSSMTGDPS